MNTNPNTPPDVSRLRSFSAATLSAIAARVAAAPGDYGDGYADALRDALTTRLADAVEGGYEADAGELSAALAALSAA